MKRGLKLFLILVFLGGAGVAWVGAAGTAEAAGADQQASPARLRVWWEFRTEPEKSGGDALVPPYTEVFLVIGSKPEERLRIGRYMGNPYIHEDLTGPQLPKEARKAVLSCWTWYAGGGDEFFVFQQGRDLMVKWRPLEEGMEPASQLKVILTKKLAQNVAVTARD